MKDIILSLFQARPYPELAATVRTVIPRVVDRWMSAVIERLSSADELTLGELRNSLPRTLERLAQALESDRAAPTRELMTESQEHGLDRLEHRYNLTELLLEFDMLRPILIQEVADELKRNLDLIEFTALNIGVDLVSRRSVNAFVERQKQQLLDAVNMQSRFFAFLSHDIRGGLNAVLMNIEMLKIDLPREPRFEPALEDLDAIRRSLLDTVGIMGRFLDAERLRTGKIQPKIAELDLQQLVADATIHFRMLAAGKGITLQEDIAPGLTLHSDRELASMILQNLVGNAIKYSSGGIVRIWTTEEVDGCCRISVSDQGPGIAPEKIATIFETFKRGDTHGQTGLGLGLSIVDHAARLLDAKITVDSKPNVGTVFHIRFPRCNS